MNGRKNAKPQDSKKTLPTKSTTKSQSILVKAAESMPMGTVVALKPADDPVNHPSHYTQGKVECIDAIESMIGSAAFLGFLRGQVVKYTWRMEHKGGKQDAQKAQWYNNHLIKKLEEYANAGTR